MPYHFPVYYIDEKPSNIVIIRGFTSYFILKSRGEGESIVTLLHSLCPLLCLTQPSAMLTGIEQFYPLVQVETYNARDAMKVVRKMDGYECEGRLLSARVGLKLTNESFFRYSSSSFFLYSLFLTVPFYYSAPLFVYPHILSSSSLLPFFPFSTRFLRLCLQYSIPYSLYRSEGNRMCSME